MADYSHLDPWKHFPNTSNKTWSHQNYGDYAKQPKQTPVNIFSLFPNIDRWAIGYDSMFELLEKMSVSKAAGFPPYNIIKNEDNYEIVMALAGYKREQLSIKVEERTLIVETIDKDSEDPSGEVIHQGIAQRNFRSTFVLGEYVQVKGAKLEDGLLTINLELELPEEKKPKHVPIN